MTVKFDPKKSSIFDAAVDFIVRHSERKDGVRMDMNQVQFLRGQLEAVESRVFETLRAEIEYRKFIPVDSSINPGAATVAYRMYDAIGMAALVANYADDIPFVDVTLRSLSTPVESIAAAYQWSFQELRASAMSGTPLDTMKARFARRAIEARHDQLAATGDANAQIPGFINNPNISLVAGLTGSWNTQSAANILADLYAIVAAIPQATNNVHKPDTLLIANNRFHRLAQLRVGTDNQTPLLQSFVENNLYVKNVAPWHRLDSADAAGTGPRAVCYPRNPEILEYKAPVEYEEFEPERVNMSWKVASHGRSGGTHVRYPMACVFADGI